jgi:hypothetical protein
MPCYDGRDEIEQRKDEIQRRIREARDTHVLYRMIEREEDIKVGVAALEAQAPPGCETYAPPMPLASSVQTAYFGNVRVAAAFDPVEGRTIMRADLYYRQAQHSGLFNLRLSSDTAKWSVDDGR